MTATEITTSNPADEASEEGPNSKTASPVKEKTPAEVKVEANTLLPAADAVITKLAQASCEDEEPSDLQLTWETERLLSELVKGVFRKQLETGGEDKTKLEERLISTLLALGEVSIENGNYKQAVEDIQECLKKQECLPKDAR